MELLDLVKAAQQGEESAFEEICGRFTGLVKKYAIQPHLRPLGEEAEAEAWLAVVKAVKSYEPDTGVQVAGYIDSQIKYALWNLFKRERRKWEHESAIQAGNSEDGLTILDTLQAADNTEAACEGHWVSEVLLRALATLPERQNQAVVMTLVHGRRLVDAAAQMGVSPQAVHKLQQRGVARLRGFVHV